MKEYSIVQFWGLREHANLSLAFYPILSVFSVEAENNHDNSFFGIPGGKAVTFGRFS